MKITPQIRFLLTAAISVVGLSTPVQTIRFSDASAAAGLGDHANSYAVAAADFNADGWPDIAVSRHSSVVLLVNQRGRFETVELEHGRDSHGLTWSDYNGDGWPDLYVSRGGRRGRAEGWSNGLYLNDGQGQLQPVALQGSLANRGGRGRAALPLDIDADQKTDLLVLNHQRPSYLVNNLHDQKTRPIDGLLRGGGVVHWTPGRAEFFSTGLFPARAAIARNPMIPLPLEIRRSRNLGLTRHIVSADFNNDLWPDLYLVRGIAIDHQVQTQGNEILFNLVSHGPKPSAFSFAARGTFVATLWVEGAPARRVGLGASDVLIDGTITLNGDDDRLRGESSDDAAVPLVLWREGELIHVQANLSDGRQSVSGRIEFSRPPVLQWTGKEAAPVPGVLAINHSDFFVADRKQRDFGDGTDGLAADFDHDGDLDLYLVNGGFSFGNPDNAVLTNRGGMLYEVHAGPASYGSDQGRGCCAVSIDYDRDGDLDLFVANGEGGPPGNLGPEQLLRNDSAPGHWLMVELKGPAVWGAQVRVQSGDTVQLRQMTPGNGRMATSWLPLHFGLGAETTAEVEIQWPGGETDRINTDVDRYVTFQQPVK